MAEGNPRPRFHPSAKVLTLSRLKGWPSRPEPDQPQISRTRDPAAVSISGDQPLPSPRRPISGSRQHRRPLAGHSQALCPPPRPDPASPAASLPSSPASIRPPLPAPARVAERRLAPAVLELQGLGPLLQALGRPPPPLNAPATMSSCSG